MIMGVVRTSFKENEKRVPIYPEHLSWIAPTIRKNLVFERDYGRDYGFPDTHFIQAGCSLAAREDLFRTADVLILPKPTPRDLQSMREHQVLWGWVHCVQQFPMAQAAIDRKLTLIAWEAMHDWGPAGEKRLHIFYRNNEVAGYAAALHALQLLGIDGHYGPRRKVVCMGYGSVTRGAIYALQGRGFNNIHVYTKRPLHLVADQNPDVYYHHLLLQPDGSLCGQHYDGSVRPFIDELAEADIICNGVLQDTDHPLMFVEEGTVGRLRARSLILDVSCDQGMGFSFARPTTFDDPVFTVGDGLTYYSVDHTPSYLWNAASREVSRALIPFLQDMQRGTEGWKSNEIIRRAIAIQDGRIQDPKILSFQKRAPEFPHPVLDR